jgi:hypothetical protein
MFKSMLGDDAESIAAQVDKDPKMLQQLLGFWKQLDNMADTDKKSYDEFVKKNRAEYEEEQKKINAEKEKKRII